jgi:hypothetical protein
MIVTTPTISTNAPTGLCSKTTAISSEKSRKPEPLALNTETPISASDNLAPNGIVKCSKLNERLEGSYCEKTFEDGTVLKGEFKEDTLIKGTTTYSSGGKDIGTFNDGDLHGENCTRIYPKKEKTLKGTFENNELIKGVIDYSSGKIEVGIFENSLLIKGKRTYANGIREEGEFLNNKLHGSGIRQTSEYEEDGIFEFGIFKNGKLTHFDRDAIEIGPRKDGTLHGENCTRIRSDTNITETGTFKDNEFTKGTVIRPNGNKETGERNKECQIIGPCQIEYFTGQLSGTNRSGTCEFGSLINGTITHTRTNSRLNVSSLNQPNLLENFTNLELDPPCEDVFKEAQTPFLYNHTQASLHKTFMDNFNKRADSFFDRFIKDIEKRYNKGAHYIGTILKSDISNINYADLDIIASQFHGVNEETQLNVLAYLTKLGIDTNENQRGHLPYIKIMCKQMFKELLNSDTSVFIGLRMLSRFELSRFSIEKSKILFLSFIKHINNYIKDDLENIDLSIELLDSFERSNIVITNLEHYKATFETFYNTTEIMSPQLFLPLDQQDFQGFGYRIPKSSIKAFRQKKPSEKFKKYFPDENNKNNFFQVSDMNYNYLQGKIMGEAHLQPKTTLAQWNTCAKSAYAKAEANYNSLTQQQNILSSYLVGFASLGLLVGFLFCKNR